MTAGVRRLSMQGFKKSMSAVFSYADNDPSSDRQVAQLRVPPHSIEAESSVLGGLLLDNGAWDRVGDLLVEGDFYRHEHKLIFTAMEQLINELIKRGGRKNNFEAKLFGGGHVMRNFTTMNVGERNADFVLEFLRIEGIRVASQDLLDIYPRRVAFFPATGRALCKKLAQADASLVAAEQQYNAKLKNESVGGNVELF